MDAKDTKKPAASAKKPKVKVPSAKSLKKKKQLPPGCKPTDPPNYTFDPKSAIGFQITAHSRFFKCKIDGIPRPQYRSFATTKASPSKVRLSNPSKPNLDSFRKAFSEALLNAHASIFTLQGKPCILTVRFFFPRPKKHFVYNTDSASYTLDPSAPIYVSKKPDLDNCIKLILDALQDVCYKDDLVVAHLDAAKVYDHTQLTWKKDNSGCTIIKVTEIDESNSQLGCSCLSCKTRNT